MSNKYIIIIWCWHWTSQVIASTVNVHFTHIKSNKRVLEKKPTRVGLLYVETHSQRSRILVFSTPLPICAVLYSTQFLLLLPLARMGAKARYASNKFRIPLIAIWKTENPCWIISKKNSGPKSEFKTSMNKSYDFRMVGKSSGRSQINPEVEKATKKHNVSGWAHFKWRTSGPLAPQNVRYTPGGKKRDDTTFCGTVHYLLDATNWRLMPRNRSSDPLSGSAENDLFSTAEFINITGAKKNWRFTSSSWDARVDTSGQPVGSIRPSLACVCFRSRRYSGGKDSRPGPRWTTSWGSGGRSDPWMVNGLASPIPHLVQEGSWGSKGWQVRLGSKMAEGRLPVTSWAGTPPPLSTTPRGRDIPGLRRGPGRGPVRDGIGGIAPRGRKGTGSCPWPTQRLEPDWCLDGNKENAGRGGKMR